MDMFLNLEDLVLCLQVHADADIQRLVLVGQRVVVSILHITACELVPLVDIDVVLDELRVEVFDEEVLTLQVNDGTLLAFLVDEDNRTDASLLGYEGIVSTEVWCDMYNTGTVISGHVVAGNHLKGIAHRLDGGHQLLIFHAYEVGTFVASHDAIRNQLVATLELRQFATIGDSSLSGQIGVQTSLGQHQRHLVGSIGVVGLHSDIVNLRAYAEG